MFLDDDDVRFAGDALLDTPDPVQSDFADADSYLQESGSTGPEMASVTMSPIGDGKFRVFEKNDGDPSFYEAGDVNNPQNRTAVRDDEIRFANPRENDAAVQLQGIAGRYTRDGNHFADANENGGTAYDRPRAVMYGGGVTQHPKDMSKVVNLLEYAIKDREWQDAYQAGQFKRGTNSYVLDSSNPDHVRKLRGFYGSTVR